MTGKGIIRTLNYLSDFSIFKKFHDDGYCRKYRYVDTDKNTIMDAIVFRNDDIVTFKIKYIGADYMEIIQRRYVDYQTMKDFRFDIANIIQEYIVDFDAWYISDKK